MNSRDTQASTPLRIGLTGGIASGKSTVADMFAALGVPIIDTDVIARQVVQPGEPALAEIRQAFGDGVICADGSLDRQALRAIVFADPAKRKQLEAILHPRIRAEAARLSARADGSYQLVVVPLLAESPMRRDMDRILVVDCSEEVQLARLLARDNESIEQARRIIASQASRDERLRIADDIIRNDGDREETEKQVRILHNLYVELAGQDGC